MLHDRHDKERRVTRVEGATNTRAHRQKERMKERERKREGGEGGRKKKRREERESEGRGKRKKEKESMGEGGPEIGRLGHGRQVAYCMGGVCMYVLLVRRSPEKWPEERPRS